jgi:hypothetical protein
MPVGGETVHRPYLLTKQSQTTSIGLWGHLQSFDLEAGWKAQWTGREYGLGDSMLHVPG